MTKEQALSILDQALAAIQTTRQNHQAIMNALAVLASGEEQSKKE